MLKVVCVNSGNYLGRGTEYTNILYDMVRRNLPEGFEGEFVCFTDGPGEYSPGITVKPLPSQIVTGWYQKLALFREGLFEPGDRILYLDLDKLICGRLDKIVKYDGKFAILRDFYRPNSMQSAVMMWPAGFGKGIWNEYVWAGYPEVPGGDQAWIESHLVAGAVIVDYLQDIFPNTFVSYKKSGGKIPKGSVVCFHGDPRPHEVTTGWVPEVWKIGGLTRAELDTVANTENAVLFANVKANAARDLPWLTRQKQHDGHAVIVGGGPSVEGKVEEIRWRQSLGQQVWALNGSARWLRKNGIGVDVHVIVDARYDNVRFVQDPRQETTYLIASQCHAAVFALLSNNDVVVWHSNAPGIEEVIKGDERSSILIGGGSTVGLSAMVIASVLGYRYIHLYGFDSSVVPDAHHAYPQEGNDADIIVDVMVEDGTKFRATPWMVQQAEEFRELADFLTNQGVEVITVAGDGLLPYLARFPMPSVVAEVRARELLSRLPEGPVRGAEIGVFGGDMSMRLLARRDLELIMVDAWDGSVMIDREDFHASLTQEQQEEYMKLAQDRTAYAGERVKIIRETSRESVKGIPDHSLDFVFIDGDHAYPAVACDLTWWHPKLKPGGLLCGHDYANMDFPHFGVTRAVDEWIDIFGLTLELGDNFTWFVRLPDAARIAAE